MQLQCRWLWKNSRRKPSETRQRAFVIFQSAGLFDTEPGARSRTLRLGAGPTLVYSPTNQPYQCHAQRECSRHADDAAPAHGQADPEGSKSPACRRYW